MKLASIQSNYIPWKGYFDIINSVDVFLLFDCAPYTEGDWRNRNRLMSRHGPKWLTIPVNRSQTSLPINQVHAAGVNWRRKHWESLRHWYGGAPYFKDLKEVFEDLYLGSMETRLSLINFVFISTVCGLLGVDTELLCETVNPAAKETNTVICDLCRYFAADTYVTGPAARAYMDLDQLAEAGVRVQWMDYSTYPEYEQRFGLPFEHGVSILDALFNLGVEGTRQHMLSFGPEG